MKSKLASGIVVGGVIGSIVALGARFAFEPYGWKGKIDYYFYWGILLGAITGALLVYFRNSDKH